MSKDVSAASLVRSDALLVHPFQFPPLPKHKTIMGITIIENPLLPPGSAMLTDGKTGVILRSTNAGGEGRGASPRTSPPPCSVVHQCPPDGAGVMPCCGRTPFEVPRTDRMTADASAVTCKPNAPLQTASGTRASLQAVVGLTKSDKEFLADCPKGRWFSEDEMVLWRRYQYRLRRLDVAGVAEWRGGGVVGCREYHIKANNAVRGAAEPRTLDGLVGGTNERSTK
jgi:hypothetical protein